MASIFRRILGESEDEGTWVQADNIMSAKILGYAGRTSDRDLIQSTILARYGTGIRLVKDAATGIDYEVYSKRGFDIRMRAGHIKTICTGLGHKIAGAIGTLFTEESQNFDLFAGEGVDVSDAAELLKEMRNGEQFVEALAQADVKSVWVGSMPIFIEFVDGKLKYHVTDPGKIQALYEEAIFSNDRPRATDLTDIEDASCVVIETGCTDDEVHSYVAIFGRTDGPPYPNGRYVFFKSSGDGHKVPEPGEDMTWDWIDPITGNLANPLSWYANENPELDIPEYPIATIYSGMIDEDRLFPMSESLLQEALESDVDASHIMSTADENSKGTHVFTKSDEGGHQRVPKSLRGEVSLEGGQKLEVLRSATDGPKIAWELNKEVSTSTSQGWRVPDFYVRSEDHTVEASSGVALKVRSGPLLKLRGRRERKNAPSIHKIFKIEKALISVFADADESTITLLEKCDQTWDPGSPEFPEDEAAINDDIERSSDNGLYDTIEAIRVKYRLASEKEAIDKYEQLLERAKKYPPLVEPAEEENDGGFGNEDQDVN